MIAHLADAFGVEPSPERVLIYIAHLADLDPAALRAAVDRCIDGSPYFPTVAELRAAAREEIATAEPPRIPYVGVSDAELDARAAERRRNAPLWGEVRRVIEGAPLRPFSEALAAYGIEPDPEYRR